MADFNHLNIIRRTNNLSSMIYQVLEVCGEPISSTLAVPARKEGLLDLLHINQEKLVHLDLG